MSATPRELSDRVADLVESLGAAIARIATRSGNAASGVVWSEGVVVTTQHSLDDDEPVQVGLGDGRVVGASLAGRDPATDLAVLRLESATPPTPAWAEPELRVGTFVLALGRPGQGVRARQGIIEALGGGWRTWAGGRVDRFIQADLDLPAGYTGGALVDLDGRVLGLNTAGLRRGAAATIPTATVGRVARSLLDHGTVRRGFLGVGTYPVRLPAPAAALAGQSDALLVVSVQPGGPAEGAGVLLGDALLSLGGEAVCQVTDLLGLLDEERIGRELKARVLRAGEVRELPIVLGTRAAG